MTDSGREGGVSFARGASNTWIAAWNTTFNLGGTIGTDPDVVFSRVEEVAFPLRITRFTHSAGQVEFRWHGGPPLYQVSWKPSLLSATWMDLGLAMHEVSASFPNPSPSNAFFQVISGP